MDERGKSDGPVVPAKLPNKAARAVAGVVEERGPAKGNTASTTHPGRSAGHGALSGLERVREVARRDKEARFTALLHHVTVERLRAAYRAIRPLAAPGVDGVTWEAYGQDLRIFRTCTVGCTQEATGHDRRDGFTSRKRMGGCGPLGIATLEDKILQRPSRCSTPSTRRAFGAFPTGFGQGATRIRRWMRSRSGSGGRR